MKKFSELYSNAQCLSSLWQPLPFKKISRDISMQCPGWLGVVWDEGREKRSLSPCSASSIQFSCSVVSDSVTPWITARQASLSITNSQSLLNLMPISRWGHPAISSSVVPFSSCPQSPPASGSFPMSQLFGSGGQSIGVSASASVLPMNT